MKKKFLITILSLVCVLACAFGLAACGENNQPPVHTHEWSQTWEKNETHHWHYCTASGCDITDNSQKDGYAEHDYSGGECICGYKPDYTVGLEYGSNNDSYYVKGIGTAKDTAVIIPSEYEGMPVTSIDGSAFANCNNIVSITIPDTVTEIGNKAFDGCSSLASITIPNSVTVFGYQTFNGCSSLTSITLPDGINSIVSNMFSGCSALASINIPESVTTIGNSAFDGCSNLTSISIPDGVTIIAASAFKNCSALTSISIPATVTKIYSSAFSGCSSLTDLTISSGETSIDGNVFDGCPIETATIPVNACSYISNSALKTVVITSGEIINDNAFQDCSSLTSITLPATITSIGDEAFLNCTNLTSITFNGTKEQWNSIQIGSNWSYNTGNFTVHCSDGEIEY